MFNRKSKRIAQLEARVGEHAKWKGEAWKQITADLGDAIVHTGRAPIGVPPFVYDLYHDGLAPVVRYQDTNIAQAGFQNLLFRGTPIVRHDLRTAA